MNQILKTYSLLLILIISAFNSVNAQEIKVNAKLDTNLILIGDQLKFRIEVEQDRDIYVELPVFNDTITNSIEIVERSETDTTFLTDKIIRLEQEYTVTSFDSGFHVIPSIPFPFVNQSIKDTILSRPLLLQVYTFQIDSVTGITDIKPPINTPITFKEIIPYISYSLAGIIILLLIIWLIIRLRRNKPITVIRQKPKEPAHKIALRELDLLQEKKLWQQSKFKDYHSTLTDIIRRYIEDRFDINAMEQTSNEVLDAIKHANILSAENYEKLSQMLSIADFVKFAKLKPLPDENERSMKHAYDFVLSTKVKTDLTSTKTEKDDKTVNKDIEKTTD